MAPLMSPRPKLLLGARIWEYAPAAAALAAAAFLALRLAPDDVPVFSDTLREFIAARDCAASASCAGIGPSSSYILFHGFIWQRFLSWWMGLDLPLRLIPSAVALFYALSMVPVLRLMERLSGRAAAAAAWAGCIFLAFDHHLADPIWSPGLVAPIVNLFIWCAGTAWLASGWRRTAAAAAAAFVLSLASQAHTEALLFLPGAALFLLWRAPAGGRGRAALKLLGLALVMAAGWQVFSAGSLRLNLSRFGSFSSPELSAYAYRARDLLRFFSVAAAFAGLVWLSRRRGVQRPEEGFFAWAAGSYLLGLFPVVFGHETPWRFYVPVLPFLSILAARAAQPFLDRRPWMAAGLAAALLLGAAGRYAAPANDHALRLGEVRSLVRALTERGYDVNAAFRYLSGGQRAYVDLLYGMWLFAPCLREVPVLGAAPAGRERIVLVEMDQGHPVPSAMAPLSPVRVAGRRSDFFLFQVPAYVHLDEFTELSGGRAKPSRGFGISNQAFGRRCWDGESLAGRMRDMLDPTTDALRFPVRLPPGAAPHTLFLPAVEGLPEHAGRCAGRVVRVEGLDASVSGDGRALELRGGRNARQGAVTVSWPFADPRCFPDRFVRYPLPMLELPSRLFSELRDALEPGAGQRRGRSSSEPKTSR